MQRSAPMPRVSRTSSFSVWAARASRETSCKRSSNRAWGFLGARSRATVPAGMDRPQHARYSSCRTRANTEETLAAFEEIHDRGARPVAVSSGGPTGGARRDLWRGACQDSGGSATTRVARLPGSSHPCDPCRDRSRPRLLRRRRGGDREPCRHLEDAAAATSRPKRTSRSSWRPRCPGACR